MIAKDNKKEQYGSKIVRQVVEIIYVNYESLHYNSEFAKVINQSAIFQGLYGALKQYSQINSGQTKRHKNIQKIQEVTQGQNFSLPDQMSFSLEIKLLAQQGFDERPSVQSMHNIYLLCDTESVKNYSKASKYKIFDDKIIQQVQEFLNENSKTSLGQKEELNMKLFIIEMYQQLIEDDVVEDQNLHSNQLQENLFDLQIWNLLIDSIYTTPSYITFGLNNQRYIEFSKDQ
ncbi:hypothetical protein ABPG74_007668 [Tetrahymena malaccensis]